MLSVLEWLIENRHRVVDLPGITCNQVSQGKESPVTIGAFVSNPSYPNLCPTQMTELIAKNKTKRGPLMLSSDVILTVQDELLRAGRDPIFKILVVIIYFLVNAMIVMIIPLLCIFW